MHKPKTPRMPVPRPRSPSFVAPRPHAPGSSCSFLPPMAQAKAPQASASSSYLTRPMPVLKGVQAPMTTIAMMKRWFSSYGGDGPEVQVEVGAAQPSPCYRFGLLGAQQRNTTRSYARLINGERIVSDAGSDATEDEGAAACGGKSKHMGWCLKLLICLSLIAMGAVGAFCVMASLGLAQIPLLSSAPAADGSAIDAAAAALADTRQSARARRLSDKYVQLRFGKDVMEMQHIFAEDIELHVDVSRAGMLVGMKIKSLLGLHSHLTGRDSVMNFYQALPAEPGDKQPRSESFQCVGDACVISATVHRPVIGRIVDIATLHWDPKEDLLRRLDLSFSAE